MFLTRLNNWLLPYHAFSFDLTITIGCILYVPMTGFELYSMITLVFNGNLIGEDIVKLPGAGILWLVFCLCLDTSFCVPIFMIQLCLDTVYSHSVSVVAIAKVA